MMAGTHRQEEPRVWPGPDLTVDREASGQMTWRQDDMLAFEARQLR